MTYVRIDNRPILAQDAEDTIRGIGIDEVIACGVSRQWVKYALNAAYIDRVMNRIHNVMKGPTDAERARRTA